MNWTIGHHSPKEPELLEYFFQTLGRALFFAVSYEQKCRYILKTIKLVEKLEEDPTLKILEVATSIKDKRLYFTLDELSRYDFDQKDIEMLIEAKDARNYIAHESVVYINIESSEKSISRSLEALKDNCIKLLKGDNIISKWVYEMEEKEYAPTIIQNTYVDFSINWIFGNIKDVIS